MASWTMLVKPDYNTKFDQPYEHSMQQEYNKEEHSRVPKIKVAIPRASQTFQAPKNGLPVNPSPHPSVDPAIQAPAEGVVMSPTEYRSPILEQREYLSPRDHSSPRYTDFTQQQQQRRPSQSYSLSRSSSQTSLERCQHCHCCKKQKGHARSDSYSSIASSRTSSSINLSSGASPHIRSPAYTPPMEQKRSSAFERTFKFLQRSSSLEVDVAETSQSRTRDDVNTRKRSTSILTTKKKMPSKKVVFEMVTEDDHWADEY